MDITPIKKYIIYLKSDFRYSRFNLPFAEGHAKDPKETVTLKRGLVLWSQEDELTLSQLLELKESGFHYQWGAMTAYAKIPKENIGIAEVKPFDIF